MPQSPEQDRPYEPITEDRKHQWFDGLMSRALTKGVHITPEDFGHELSRAEASLPMSRYDRYVYTFTYEELVRAGIDPAWATVELNFGLEIHPQDANSLMSYISLNFQRLVVWTRERTAVIEQSILLNKESPDHIAESVSLLNYRDSSNLGQQIQDFKAIKDLYDRTDMGKLDAVLARQLDRLSRLD